MGVAVAAFALALLASSPAVPTATDPAPIAVAPLAPWIQRLHTIEVEIEGQKARMLFDSGAGVTLVTSAFAKKIGCEPYGQLTGFTMTGEKGTPRKCGSHTLQVGAHAATIELLVGGDEGTPPGAPVIDGILGLNAFEGHAITIDFGDRQLIVESPASLAARTAGLEGGEIRLMREMGGLGLSAFQRISGPKGNLWFLVDSNNQARTRMSPAGLGEFGIDEASITAGLADPAKTIPLALTIPGQHGTPEDGPVQVAPKDIIYDGALNERLVFWHNVTLDLAQLKSWYVFDPKP
ncbi:MAG: retroviral-like aspartic protease family protein [Pseudomonadota bacterium]|nr:retroviral-like aspartic protease family protein [Pseudomonadota bacterium]